jgi:hypothetical protein
MGFVNRESELATLDAWFGSPVPGLASCGDGGVSEGRTCLSHWARDGRAILS